MRVGALLLLLAGFANADEVYICVGGTNDKLWSACPSVSTTTTKLPNDLINYCRSSITAGATTCPPASTVQQKNQYTPPYAWTLTKNRGYQRYSDVVFAPITPPVCTHPASPATSQPVNCAAPTTGTWTQTRPCTESACPPAGGPTTWTCGAWTPTTPPAGACAQPFQPLTLHVTTTPAVLFGVPGAPIIIHWTASDPAATCLSDFPGSPAGNPGTAELAFPAPAITSIAYRIGCVRASDNSGAVYMMTVQSVPPVLPRLVRPPPGCYPTEPGCPFAEQPDGHVKVWVVDGTDAVWLYTSAYNPAAYPMCVDSFLFTHANADRQWARCQAKLNAADSAIAEALDLKFSPRFSAVGGQVYYLNADGTFGTALTREGVPVLASAGEKCWLGRKVMNGGKRYQAVAKDAEGIVLPNNAYAECVRTDAPASGWP